MATTVPPAPTTAGALAKRDGIHITTGMYAPHPSNFSGASHGPATVQLPAGQQAAGLEETPLASNPPQAWPRSRGQNSCLGVNALPDLAGEKTPKPANNATALTRVNHQTATPYGLVWVADRAVPAVAHNGRTSAPNHQSLCAVAHWLPSRHALGEK